jgi:putative SOS response-associated peptidase YedK
MCGRYAIGTSRLPRIENALGIPLPALAPRYNVAPTQKVPIVRATAQRRYELVEARWGLIPAWSNEPRTAYATFNARVETVAAKPAFRAAYRARRCLVPASGFYEWREEGGRKQPWYFCAADGRELARTRCAAAAVVHDPRRHGQRPRCADPRPHGGDPRRG